MKELEEISKKNPFKVPDNYFEGLNGRILRSVSGIEPAEEKKPLIRKLRPYILAAASVAIIAVSAITAVYLLNSGRGRTGESVITLTEFTDNYLNDIDLLTLENVVSDNISFTDLSGVNGNDIIDYLVSENINDLDIYEHLQ
jgi:hypothetical protein